MPDFAVFYGFSEQITPPSQKKKGLIVLKKTSGAPSGA
jgi:hypothetical protein